MEKTSTRTRRAGGGMRATALRPHAAVDVALNAPPGRRNRGTARSAIDGALSVPEKMVAATAELIAKRGPENITVRDICEKSGANVNAVYYYFGSKEALIKAVLLILLEPVNVARKSALETARKRHGEGPLDIEVILDALIRPTLEGTRTADGGRVYVRTEQHLRAVPSSEYSCYISANLDHYAKIFLDALEEALPHLARGEIVWRYEYIRGAMIHMLGNCDPLSTKFAVLAGSHPIIDIADNELVLQELIGAALTGMKAPSLMKSS